MLIHLASQSPRRRELLAQIGVPYKTLRVEVPEVHKVGEKAADYVMRLAVLKAQAGLQHPELAKVPGVASLGADTIVCCDEAILEKPQSLDDLQRMLAMLSGRSHEVMTAVCCCSADKERRALSVSRVSFKTISSQQIERYWQSGEPQDKAGGYAIQGLGAVFVARIEGSYSGIVGLPIDIVSDMLEEFGVFTWQEQTQQARA